jgi:predicted CXXCH cytochrome family protein
MNLHTGIALGLLAGALFASDPPHDSSPTVTAECTTCHADHHDQGGILTKFTTNALLCQACHYTGNPNNGLPVENADKAAPGADGTHHAFEVSATNAAYGALPPQDTQMALRVMGGNLVCSTCHNQHSAANKAGTQSVSTPQRVVGSGAGTVTIAAVTAAANPKAYLMEIVAGGTPPAATFRLSNDNGATWWGWNGAAWVAYAGNPRATGAGIPLNDGANVSVTFSGAFTAGDRYYFYVSYPFLRAALDTGDNATGAKFCRDCHRDWTMEHGNLESNPGGAKRMGHPVGIALNANGRAYDRAVPLDGNGGAQGGGAADANATNDLKLDGGRIQCWTCHGVHYADGNTLTEDRP